MSALCKPLTEVVADPPDENARTDTAIAADNSVEVTLAPPAVASTEFTHCAAAELYLRICNDVGLAMDTFVCPPIDCAFRMLIAFALAALDTALSADTRLLVSDAIAEAAWALTTLPMLMAFALAA
ncbi:MAG TPA: hypothetical protein VFB99_08840, partial [Vicinamibacterales bacterium]|nr:hypothetical protein [Vicinamibacterales bacterium]